MVCGVSCASGHYSFVDLLQPKLPWRLMRFSIICIEVVKVSAILEVYLVCKLTLPVKDLLAERHLQDFFELIYCF